jgi:mannose-6-phosphate isomerase-like protein (cupin superfamily)
MPDDRQSEMDHVRSALRAHDAAPESPDPPAALEEGVTIVTLDLEGEDRFQRLRQELGVRAFGVNLVRLRPRQQGRIHRHERQEELYVVLEGTLTMEVEGEPRELPRGSAARVGPSVRRRLSNRAAETLAVLAIGGAEPHEGRDGTAFTSWEDETGASPQDIPLPPDLDAS